MDFRAITSSMGIPAAGFLRREDFGKDFFFGSATSAFQIEGASDKDGRGKSIWDDYADDEKRHGKSLFHPYGEDAVCHYKHYEKDVEIMKKIGFNAYRFSISWSRILPTGRAGCINQKGIDFYKKLLNKLKVKEIEPFVTLLHFDVPQALEDEYRGFLDRRIADDFRDYADICFREFGSQVKYWITINETWSFTYGAYVKDSLAPGLGLVEDQFTVYKKAITNIDGSISHLEKENDADSFLFLPCRYSRPTSILKKSIENPIPICSQKEDPYKFAYIVAHNQLLAHGKAAKLYKDNYQRVQNGKIGITLVTHWFEPYDCDSQKDKDAAKRALDFSLGWFMHPMIYGEYPKTMRTYVKEGHLPVDDLEADKSIIQNSCDFIGLNYYTAIYVSHRKRKDRDGKKPESNYVTDQKVKHHVKDSKGKSIGKQQGAAGWIYRYPKGIMDLLLHVKREYNNPLIYITENGVDDPDDHSAKLWDSIYDHQRVSFLHDHLSFVKEAKRQHVNVQGYFVWSLLDNFEWKRGFTSRFGITYVDYDSEKQERHPKLSAAWLKSLLENQGCRALDLKEFTHGHQFSQNMGRSAAIANATTGALRANLMRLNN
ncbi:hypothetical protein ACH5RR_015027 [Cinchona calisaya]|uniref:Uncharacterized protein n=1 Tax=Cinchona calisaya TaxID=153742 RepID=A0ABD2ZSD6_9GENT